MVAGDRRGGMVVRVAGRAVEQRGRVAAGNDDAAEGRGVVVELEAWVGIEPAYTALQAAA